MTMSLITLIISNIFKKGGNKRIQRDTQFIHFTFRIISSASYTPLMLLCRRLCDKTTSRCNDQVNIIMTRNSTPHPIVSCSFFLN